jgi:hypothetical protein
MLRGTVGARSIRTWPVRTHCIQPTTVHTRLMSTGPVWILLASHCTSKRSNSAAASQQGQKQVRCGEIQSLGKNCPNAVWLRFRLLTWGNVMLRGWRGALVCQSRFCHQLGRRLFCRLHTTHHVRDDCISFGRLWQHCLQQSCAWSNRCHIWWRPLSSCGWSIRASVWRAKSIRENWRRVWTISSRTSVFLFDYRRWMIGLAPPFIWSWKLKVVNPGPREFAGRATRGAAAAGIKECQFWRFEKRVNQDSVPNGPSWSSWSWNAGTGLVRELWYVGSRKWPWKADRVIIQERRFWLHKDSEMRWAGEHTVRDSFLLSVVWLPEQLFINKLNKYKVS